MARLYNFFKIQFYTFKLDVTFKHNYFSEFFFYDVNDSIFMLFINSCLKIYYLLQNGIYFKLKVNKL